MANPSEKEFLSPDNGSSNAQCNSCLTFATDSQLTEEPESVKKKERGPLLPLSFDNDVNNRESKRQRIQEECTCMSIKEEVHEPQIIETQASYDNFLSEIQQPLKECTFTSIKEEVYEPQIIETQASCDNFLSEIQQPLNIDTTAADEKLVNPLPNQVSDQLVSLGSFVTDFHDAGSDTIGSEYGWLCDQRQSLDLESIPLLQDGLSMANKKCEVSVRPFRKQKKGYEEVYLPALEPKPLAAGEKLVLIKDMPSWAQPAFEGMTELNRVQSRVYETALKKADNILLGAPTGAGKTIVAMLTILHQIGLHMDDDGSFNHGDYKIVYVAPMKALVAEVVGILSNRLKYYGVTVIELTGDQDSTRKQIKEAQIIVTTPEKWDKITRKLGDLTFVRLLIIDEMHVLNDKRGPVLESIVARTVRQAETRKEHIRLVGLSATLANYDDVALFLLVDLKKGVFHFDNSYRHVPLAQQCIGIMGELNYYQRNKLMNEICYEKVIGVTEKHQVLIFVYSRKETLDTAREIIDTARAKKTVEIFCREDSREILQEKSKLVESEDLEYLLPYGLAIHHAGIKRVDRVHVEKLFAKGHIQVLVSTTTLSKGVNLPAHSVIIRGTQRYNSTEYCPLDFIQMLSRAGKPWYDTYSEGIIITGHSELQHYLTLMNQQLPIESQFVSNLPDQLNAEIVLGTIQNAKEAQHWLGYTYLYFRMMKNPTLYGLPADLVHDAAIILDKHKLVEYDRKTGNLEVTDLGRIASKYYITHQTIGTYDEHLNPTMSDIELFRLLSLSEEFKSIPVRQGERYELARLLDRVQIPIKEGLEDPNAKINVLLQAHISQLKPKGFSLTSDMNLITQNAGRLMHALYEIVYEKGWAQLAEKVWNLRKSFKLVHKDEDM